MAIWRDRCADFTLALMSRCSRRLVFIRPFAGAGAELSDKGPPALP